MADNSTKVIVGVIVILAIIGVVFLMKEGGISSYKLASRESPGQYGWTGECCTCTRAQQTLRGTVMPETREVIFRNEHVADCATACADAHARTKMARVNYDVNAFISNDPVCQTSLPVPRGYAGAGGFNDQPMQDAYYVG
jgi:hypothetical protein